MTIYTGTDTLTVTVSPGDPGVDPCTLSTWAFAPSTGMVADMWEMVNNRTMQCTVTVESTIPPGDQLGIALVSVQTSGFPDAMSCTDGIITTASIALSGGATSVTYTEVGGFGGSIDRLWETSSTPPVGSTYTVTLTFNDPDTCTQLLGTVDVGVGSSFVLGGLGSPELLTVNDRVDGLITYAYVNADCAGSAGPPSTCTFHTYSFSPQEGGPPNDGSPNNVLTYTGENQFTYTITAPIGGFAHGLSIGIFGGEGVFDLPLDETSGQTCLGAGVPTPLTANLTVVGGPAAAPISLGDDPGYGWDTGNVAIPAGATYTVVFTLPDWTTCPGAIVMGSFSESNDYVGTTTSYAIYGFLDYTDCGAGPDPCAGLDQVPAALADPVTFTVGAETVVISDLTGTGGVYGPPGSGLIADGTDHPDPNINVAAAYGAVTAGTPLHFSVTASMVSLGCVLADDPVVILVGVVDGVGTSLATGTSTDLGDGVWHLEIDHVLAAAWPEVYVVAAVPTGCV